MPNPERSRVAEAVNSSSPPGSMEEVMVSVSKGYWSICTLIPNPEMVSAPVFLTSNRIGSWSVSQGPDSGCRICNWYKDWLEAYIASSSYLHGGGGVGFGNPVRHDRHSINNIFTIGPAPFPELGDPQAAVRQSLLRPVGSPALHDLVKKRHKVLVIADDSTRPTPQRLFIPPLLTAIRAKAHMRLWTRPVISSRWVL